MKVFAFALLLFAGCALTPVPPDRGPAEVERLSKLDQGCSVNADCYPGFSCRAKACRPVQQIVAEAGELCARPQDCRSRSCDMFGTGLCQAVTPSLLSNSLKCSTDSQCRSNQCGRDGTCVASQLSRGIAGDLCNINEDCLSVFCGPAPDGRQRCQFGGPYAASCAPVGEKVMHAGQCCSGAFNLDAQSRCVAVQDVACSDQGDCRSRVGKKCADVGTTVQNEFQCCSRLAVAGRCTINYQMRFQPCAADASCPSGRTCDLSTNLCRN